MSGRRYQWVILGVICLMGYWVPGVRAQGLRLSDFLGEMVALEQLRTLPDPWYETVQFASYDRRSEGAYQPGWYANSDGFGNEPIPNVLEVLDAPTQENPQGRFLLVDETGPGVMVRTWTARMNGSLKVFLDGAEEPLYEGPAQSFLQETYKALSSVFAADLPIEIDPFRQRDACYFPVPYAKGLRVEWTGRLDQLHFYHIEVRRYAEGVAVQSLDGNVWTENLELIERTVAALANPGAYLDGLLADTEQGQVSAEIEPAAEVELFKLEGDEAREVVRLALRVRAADPVKALRQAIVRIYFDGSSQPQVESPLGDFFGSAPGVNPYDSVPFTVHADGLMVSRFPMPFARSMRMVVVNHGSRRVLVEGSVSHRTYTWQAGRSQHFYAAWAVDHGLLAGPGALSYDVPYFVGRGTGVLVGVATMLLNPCSIPTSYGNWWGEGDEKIWVDEGRFPVFFGTGSEDYYNYSWSSPDLFAHPYCGQTHNTGPGNRGFVANHRWHILDPIPFEQRLDFFMELMHHVPTPDLSYARISYVYAQPDLRDVRRPITPMDVRTGIELPEYWLPEARMGANGALFVQAEDCALLTPGEGEIFLEHGRMWAGSQLGVWLPTAEGDAVEIAFEVERGGRYRLHLVSEKGPNSGAARVYLDGAEESDNRVDLFQSGQTVLRSESVAVVDLEAGRHHMRLVSEGSHPMGGGMRIGMDYLWLQPQ